MRPFVRYALLAAGLAMVALAAPVGGQVTARPLQVEDLANDAGFGPRPALALSPDGAWLAYVVCPSRSYTVAHCGVWVRSTAGTDSARAVSPPGRDASIPSWSPDGRFLLFEIDPTDRSTLWVWDHRSAAAHPLALPDSWQVSLPEQVQWFSDRRRVLVTLAPKPTAPPARDSAGPPRATVTVLRSRPPGTRVEPAATDSTQHVLSLAAVDVGTGQLQVVASHLPSSRIYLLSPDDTQVAYTAVTEREVVAPDDGKPTYVNAYALTVVSLSTGRARVVAPRVFQYGGTMVSWSPDSRWLAYLSGLTAVMRLPRGYCMCGDLHVVAANGQEPSHRLAGGPADGFDTSAWTQLLWDAQSRFVYAQDEHQAWRGSVATWQVAAATPMTPLQVEMMAQQSGANRFWSPAGEETLVLFGIDSLTKRCGAYRADLGRGTLTRMWEADAYCYPHRSPPLGAGRTVVFLREGPTEGQNAWGAIAPFTDVRRLTLLNPAVATRRFGRPQLVDFRSTDGTPLQAGLLLPVDYVPGKRYPMVVWVYPGAGGAHGLNLFGLAGGAGYNLQLLAARGYAVLSPDVPEGTATQRQDLMKAVMPAIDRVVTLGIADADHLAVMGSSAGGYSTIELLTETRRFKAAVMNAGFGNWLTLYGGMLPTGEGPMIPLIERYAHRLGAAPWESPQRYVENSPIFSLDRVDTPLIIQAGKDDGQILIGSNEVFVGLQRLGRDVTYLQYGGEGHYIGQGPNFIDYWTRVLAFFDEHLRDIPHAAERASASPGDREHR